MDLLKILTKIIHITNLLHLPLFLLEVLSYHYPYTIIISETLRALYLGDNDFVHFPKEVGQLKNLQIVSI